MSKHFRFPTSVRETENDQEVNEVLHIASLAEISSEQVTLLADSTSSIRDFVDRYTYVDSWSKRVEATAVAMPINKPGGTVCIFLLFC